MTTFRDTIVHLYSCTLCQWLICGVQYGIVIKLYSTGKLKLRRNQMAANDLGTNDN